MIENGEEDAEMAQRKDVLLDAPIISGPGAPAISAVGTSLVIHEWTGSGPSYMHIHRSDDEAWHVLEGSLRFRLADGEVDAPAGTAAFEANPGKCTVGIDGVM
jgi:mannose-6-phosphate isomerase-like protein (cupin superfamily)